MRIPKPADVQQLESWSENQFSDWLGDGLADWFEGGGRHSFYPMHIFVDKNMTIAEDLFAVYEALSRTVATKMRNGLVIAMAYATSRPVVMALMELAAMTMAKNIVSTIPDKLLIFANNEDEESRNFLIKALLTVASVSGNTGEKTDVSVAAINAIHRIVANKAFDVRLSGGVLTTLCRVRPKQLQKHLLTMESHLHKVYAINPKFGDAEIREKRGRGLVQEVCRLVGPEILHDSLNIHCRNVDGTDWWRSAVEFYLSVKIDDGNIEITVPDPNWIPVKFKCPSDYCPVSAEILPEDPLPPEEYSGRTELSPDDLFADEDNSDSTGVQPWNQLRNAA